MSTKMKAMSFAKRALDVALATLMLVALLPAMLLFAILVKLDSDGPVFYSQIRVGQNLRRRQRRNGAQRRQAHRAVLAGLENGVREADDRRHRNIRGRPFPVLKFRTMVIDAERNGPRWCTPKDARVTRFGRILRATHLDELPQLINILRGEMSFVGPRPERPEFVAELCEKIPAYPHRLALRPGLTGLAQIRHRADVVLTDVRRKIRYDILYIKNASVLTDLKIILGTVPFLFGLSHDTVKGRKSSRKIEVSQRTLPIAVPAEEPVTVPPAAAQAAAETKIVNVVVLFLIVGVFLSGCYNPKVRPLAAPPAENTTTAAPSKPEAAAAPAASSSPVLPDNKIGKRVSALIMKSEMRLGPQDMIEVRVKDHPELTAQVPVDPWGFIKLPYVQALQINGLTEDMVEDILTQKYSEFFRQPPEVDVNVIQYNSQTVYVLGAVGYPGRYPLVNGKPMTLRDVIVAAGLPLDGAALWRVWVIRQGEPGQQPSMRHIDLYKIMYRGKLDDNIDLQSGDIVYVPFTILDSFVNFLGRIASPVTGAARRLATGATPVNPVPAAK